MPTALENLQAQLPALQQKVTDLTTLYSTQSAARDDWRNKSVACHAARDQFTLNSKKDKACNIVDMQRYDSEWGKFEELSKKTLLGLNTAKKALDDLNAQIDKLIKQGTAALNNDPQFNLAQQQLNNQAQAEAAKLAEEQKTKRTLFTVGAIIAGLGVIFGVFKIISSFRTKE